MMILSMLLLFILNFVIKGSDSALSLTINDVRYNGSPFTGLIYEVFSNGDLYRLRTFWRGKQVGTEHRWYPGGNKWEEIEFQNGLFHGQHRIWYRDGKVKFLKHFKNGKEHGEFWGWHPNGKVSDFYVFEEGKELIYKSFISDGKPFYNYVTRGTERIGLQGEEFCKTQSRNSNSAIR